MKNIEKYIMWILIFIAVGAIGSAVYFGISTDKDGSNKEENKQEEINNNKEETKQEEINNNKEETKQEEIDNNKEDVLENDNNEYVTNDKGEDNKVTQNKNYIDDKEEQQIYEIYEKFNVLTWKVAYSDNDYMLNILKGNDRKINDKYKFLVALYNAAFTKLDLDSDEANTIEKYLENKETACFTGKYVKLQDVNNKLKEFFNVSDLNINFSEDVDKWWHYDESKEIFYELGCGGYVGPETIITEYEVEKVGDDYYIYQYAAFLNYVDLDGELYGVYKNYDDFIKVNNNYIETTTNYDYKITSLNKDKFHKYAYKFIKNDKGNWYLDSIEMVK